MSDVVGYTVEEALEYHSRNKGKLAVISKCPLDDVRDLSLAYTPGVAEPCRRIREQPKRVWDYTNRGNAVAIVTDGSAVLGLGDIGPEAAMPVMEGKAILFKMLAGVDGYPICLNTQDVDELVNTVKAMQPSFGGVNLEDISAPRCFEIEDRLRKELDIPVFHDDQHGTAIVTLAGLLNALEIVGKKISEVRIVFNGAGASGMACAKFYMSAGAKDVILCDSRGAIYEGRMQNMNLYKTDIAKLTNKEGIQGSLSEAMEGADVFVGMSVGDTVTQDMVASMADDAIVFACANPTPEIMPDKAKKAGARIVATGRSDFPNQINNVLGFPGIFRGALDTWSSDINEQMKVAAAHAIASIVSDDELKEEYIITNPLHPDVIACEAAAVAKAAMISGVAGRKIMPHEVEENTRNLVEQARKVFNCSRS